MLIDRVIAFERPQSPPPRERRLSYEEKKTILDACNQLHLRTFIVLGLQQGQRKSAILELTWDRVNFETGLVDYRPQGKLRTNKKRAIVPMNKTVREELTLAKQFSQTNNVIEYNGSPVQDIKTAFISLMRRVDVRDVTPHTLRHTCASDLAAAGVSMEEIAELLQDSVETVRKHYIKYSPDYLSRATKALEG